jgi:hypothetical protein
LALDIFALNNHFVTVIEDQIAEIPLFFLAFLLGVRHSITSVSLYGHPVFLGEVNLGETSVPLTGETAIRYYCPSMLVQLRHTV